MSYDLIVIGSGPGGYVAAIRAAQLGLKTAIVEKYDTLGGTCLNVGCIPSKALLDSSEHYHQAASSFAEHGIECGELRLDFERMMGRKNKAVQKICDGVAYLMKKNKIAVFHGVGSFEDAHTVRIDSPGEESHRLSARSVLIATGSKPSSLPNIHIDKQRIISSTEALSLPQVPQKLIVIGGGVIGLELGSVYARLGAEVTVVEYLDRLIPSMDLELGRELQKVLKGLGMKFHLGHRVQSAESDGEQVTVTALRGEEEVRFTGDYCLIAVGRKAYTEGLGLDKIGLKTDRHGKIPVNEHLQSEVENVYAIGDVVAGPMLAHKAEEEGIFVAETLAGQKPVLHHHLIPNVVYTWPEVASVGATEAELKEREQAYTCGKFPFKASGRAMVSGDTQGFIKVLADAESNELLGVHMIGPRAADLIAEAVTAMAYRASAEDIARIVHAHPTYSEAFREACLAACEMGALHI